MLAGKMGVGSTINLEGSHFSQLHHEFYRLLREMEPYPDTVLNLGKHFIRMNLYCFFNVVYYYIFSRYN